MGTRADFYIGRGVGAEWLGSIGWDGYPEVVMDYEKGLHVHPPVSKELFRVSVMDFLRSRDDATFPEDGWPWPWEDSRTTDYAYAWDGGSVWVSYFGSEWRKWPFDHDSEWKEFPKMKFPNMKSRQRVTFGERSGLVIFRLPPEVTP